MADPPLTADQRWFLAVYKRLLATDPNTVHARTLIDAFTDDGGDYTAVAADTAEGRLVRVLTLTGKDGKGPPGGHFEWRVIRQIGTVSPLKRGDLGFRRELRDSVHYLRGPDLEDVEFHRGSSDQIGHFLTGAHSGYYAGKLKRKSDKVVRVRGPIAAGGALAPLGQLGEALQAAVVDQVLDRLTIGHEQFEPTKSTADDDRVNALRSFLSGSWKDARALSSGRFEDIELDETWPGASYQDLLLTWVALCFGRRVAQGVFASRREAAHWLSLMLTEQNLSNARIKPELQADVRAMKRVLGKFRAFQRSRAR